MKKGLLILVLHILINTTYSQVRFEQGYFIDTEGNKIECLIKNNDWGYNPKEIVYKNDMESKSKTLDASSIREFGVYHSLKYVSRKVNIDRSTEEVSKLGIYPNPVFKEEELFLKVLVEGKANLYYYAEGNLKRFFYSLNENKIEPLIFKIYRDSSNTKIIENTRFRQQLWNSLSCPTIERKKFENLDYRKKDLINIFSEYNTCSNAEFTTFEDKIRRKIFTVSIRPRMNFQSLSALNSLDRTSFDWGSKTGFGMGIEGEFFLPLNKNKWSLIVEPTFQSFSGRIATHEYYHPSSIQVADIDYQSVELLFGIRHYFYLNQSWKLFINGSLVYELVDFSSELNITRPTGYHLNTLEVSDMGVSNFVLGTGLKKGILGFEMRYQSTRDPLSKYVSWSSEFKMISVILIVSLPGKKELN